MTGPAVAPAAFTTYLPDDRAQIAITTALAQLGLPYVWGGDGPTAGDAGFDCSGLTTFAYRAAGIRLPRTAHTQFYAGPHVPPGAPLQPGDLVFYGTTAKIHHVGLYLGRSRMVNAPTFGKPVQIAYYRWTGDNYLGATRPAATGQPTPGQLMIPRAARDLSVPAEFVAPPALLPAEPLPAPDAPQPPEAATAAAALAARSGDVPSTAARPSPPPGATAGPPPATTTGRIPEPAPPTTYSPPTTTTATPPLTTQPPTDSPASSTHPTSSVTLTPTSVAETLASTATASPPTTATTTDGPHETTEEPPPTP